MTATRGASRKSPYILRMNLMSDGPYLTVFTSSVMPLNARRFGIAALPIHLPSKSWPVVVVTLKKRTQSAAVERFIECVREVANSFSNLTEA